MNSFIVSWRWDLGFLILPGVVGTALGLVLPPGVSGGLWGMLILVVLVDVGHTWASLYRTVFEPEQDPTLLPMAAGIALVGSVGLWSLAPQWFWTGMMGMAVFHFIRQQAGIIALYQLRERQVGQVRGASVVFWERRVVEGICGVAMLWWWAHPGRPFSWFVEGEFFFVLPIWVLWLGGMVFAGMVGWYGWQRRGEGISWGRDLYLLATLFCWWGGIGLSEGDLAFTLSNVLIHGVGYMALVQRVASERERQEREKVPVFLLFPLFLALPIGLAFAEELLWEGLVWQEYLGLGWPELVGVTPLLAVPQLTHYLLDGWIWKGKDVGRWVLGDG